LESDLFEVQPVYPVVFQLRGKNYAEAYILFASEQDAFQLEQYFLLLVHFQFEEGKGVELVIVDLSACTGNGVELRVESFYIEASESRRIHSLRKLVVVAMLKVFLQGLDLVELGF
jgi:hypothetical protein